MAVVPTRLDRGESISHRFQEYAATRSYRIAYRADAILELTSTVWTGSLFNRVDIAVLIMISPFMRVEIDLDGGDETCILCLSVPEQLLHHLSATMLATVTQHAVQRGDGLVSTKLAKDEFT